MNNFNLESYNLLLKCPTDALTEIQQSKFSTNSLILKNQETQVYTNRSDVLDYYKKRLKSKKINFKVFIKDSSNILDGIYKKEGSYYEIPINKWSSEFYSRYVTFLNQKKSEEVKTIETYHIETKKLKESEVMKRLLDQKWIYPVNIPGSFLYSGKYIQLANKLAKLYQDVMGLDCYTEECKFSHLIPISELIKTNYYYSSCANFHYHLKCTSSVEDLKKLGLKVQLEQHLDPKEIFLHSPGPNYIMNYCSCQGWWLAHKNHVFESSSILRFYDKSVPTYRDEKGKVKSLDRLEIFERFEQIFLGDKQKVLDYSLELKKKLIEFFQLCKIPFSIIYGANWFCEDVEGNGFTYDFEYPGQTKSLEIGNLSYNATLWTKPYNIKFNNKEAYSGCSGIGIQRLVYLFLINNGFEPQNWPIK